MGILKKYWLDIQWTKCLKNYDIPLLLQSEVLLIVTAKLRKVENSPPSVKREIKYTSVCIFYLIKRDNY